MRLESTKDVSLAVLNNLKGELSDDFSAEIAGQEILLSVDPPSFIRFIEEPSLWLKVFGACAAIYVKGIIEEAGKDTWRNRGRALAEIRKSSDKIKKHAKAMWRTLSPLQPKTGATVGIPIPNNPYPAQLWLTLGDENDIVVDMAMFVHYIPELVEIIKAERLDTKGASGGITIELLDDGSLQVSWFERRTEKVTRRIIPFENKSQ